MALVHRHSIQALKVLLMTKIQRNNGFIFFTKNKGIKKLSSVCIE